MGELDLIDEELVLKDEGARFEGCGARSKG